MKLRAIQTDGKRFGARAIPIGGVHDGISVWSEARGVDHAMAESEPLKFRLLLGLQPRAGPIADRHAARQKHCGSSPRNPIGWRPRSGCRDSPAGSLREGIQVKGQVSRGLKPVIRILFETMTHHAIECGWK